MKSTETSQWSITDIASKKISIGQDQNRIGDIDIWFGIHGKALQTEAEAIEIANKIVAFLNSSEEKPKVILSNKEKLHEEREAQADEILLSGMSLGEYLEYSFTQNLMA